MHFLPSLLAATLVLLSSVCSASWTNPSSWPWHWPKHEHEHGHVHHGHVHQHPHHQPTHKDCLTHKSADSIVNQFIFLLENSGSPAFAPAARKLLVPGFMDQSDSVNFMAGFPLGGITFANRSSYIETAGSQPPFGSVKTLETFHTCTKIAWRWNATGFPPPDLEVVGINIFTVDRPSSGKVDSIHVEFDSGAFLANVGNPQCKSSGTA